jgi:hypothetical protein
MLSASYRPWLLPHFEWPVFQIASPIKDKKARADKALVMSVVFCAVETLAKELLEAS